MCLPCRIIGGVCINEVPTPNSKLQLEIQYAKVQPTKALELDFGHWTERSDIEIHLKLQRMRAHPKRSNLLLTLVADPAINQLLAEDIALQQEVVIGFEGFQRLLQRTG